MREPVRILSDLHLGHRVSRIEQVSALRPLLAGAGTVIFNGDTWQELAPKFRDRSAAMLRELRTLCVEEGCEAIFLPGNHDPGWPGAGWVELAGGRIVITHGDAVFFDGSPWKREVLTGGGRVRELWAEHPRADADPAERILLARKISRELRSRRLPEGRHIWQRAWDAILPPKRAWTMVEAWLTQPVRSAGFCERYFPAAEIVILGHFHWQGSWLVGNRRVLNTGSFMNPGRAHWVEWRDGWLTRGVIRESPEECQLGPILEQWRLKVGSRRPGSGN